MGNLKSSFKSKEQQLSNYFSPKRGDLTLPLVTALAVSPVPWEAGIYTWKKNPPSDADIYAPWES